MNAIKILKKHESDIKKKYCLKKIGVFGSLARGNKKANDIDILVEFKKSVDIFEFLDLKEYLEKLLNKEVDLVTKSALKPLIKENIMKEVVYV